jgi:hypothetical protein
LRWAPAVPSARPARRARASIAPSAATRCDAIPGGGASEGRPPRAKVCSSAAPPRAPRRSGTRRRRRGTRAPGDAQWAPRGVRSRVFVPRSGARGPSFPGAGWGRRRPSTDESTARWWLKGEGRPSSVGGFEFLFFIGRGGKPPSKIHPALWFSLSVRRDSTLPGFRVSGAVARVLSVELCGSNRSRLAHQAGCVSVGPGSAV